jgi:hypothetical protein
MTTNSIDRIQGTVRTSTTGAITVDVNASVVGLTGGVDLPANIAVGISWKVGLYYRGGHPRTYLAGIPSTARANVREWTNTYATAVAASAVNFLGDVNALTPGSITDVDLGMLSYVVNKAYRAQAAFFPFTSATVDKRIDTMRRRLGPDL